jgi:leucyl aminopeptidase
MTDAPKLGFAPFARLRGVLVVFCGENLKFGTATQRALAPIGDLVRRAAAADRFTGKNGTTLDIVAPAELKLPRLIVVGTGKDSELKRKDVVKLGGIAMGKVPAVAAEATIFAEFASAIRSPTWCWVRGCAPIRSTATRPSAKTTTIGRKRSR